MSLFIDFNLPDLDWDSSIALSDGVQDDLLTLFTDHSLNQINRLPTSLDNILDIS